MQHERAEFLRQLFKAINNIIQETLYSNSSHSVETEPWFCERFEWKSSPETDSSVRNGQTNIQIIQCQIFFSVNLTGCTRYKYCTKLILYILSYYLLAYFQKRTMTTLIGVYVYRTALAGIVFRKLIHFLGKDFQVSSIGWVLVWSCFIIALHRLSLNNALDRDSLDLKIMIDLQVNTIAIGINSIVRQSRSKDYQ